MSMMWPKEVDLEWRTLRDIRKIDSLRRRDYSGMPGILCDDE